MNRAAVVATVSRLPARTFDGAAFRHLATGYQPLSGDGARTVGGRWNPPRSFPVLYLALDDETTKAEFLRLAAKQGRAPRDFLPRDLCSYEVRLQRVLDVRDSKTRRDVGLSTEPDGDDLAASQSVGEAAHLVGFEAILAPSATGSGEILAVLLDRLLPESAVEHVASQRWTEIEDLG